MDEAKVRAAAKVPTELARDTHHDVYREIWQSVFHALLSEPYDNRTATAIEEAQSRFVGKLQAGE